MNRDEYGTVYNSKENYREIAEEIYGGGRCVFAWTDQFGSQFDILMVTEPIHLGGMLQGGVKSDDLFVSIMRRGAFGFEIKNRDTHASYYDEKLHIGNGCTAKKIADLINGVINELVELDENEQN